MGSIYKRPRKSGGYTYYGDVWRGGRRKQVSHPHEQQRDRQGEAPGSPNSRRPIQVRPVASPKPMHSTTSPAT